MYTSKMLPNTEKRRKACTALSMLTRVGTVAMFQPDVVLDQSEIVWN